MSSLIAFGDSITWGAWDTAGGWVQRIRQHVDRRTLSDDTFYCEVYNMGVSGDTSQDVLHRMQHEIEPRRDQDDELHLLFLIGTNDSLYCRDTDSFQVAPGEFGETVRAAVALSEEAADSYAFIEIIPVDDRVDPVPWHSTHSYRNTYIDRYNDILHTVCNDTETPLIMIRDGFEDEMLADGVHLTSDGHTHIAAQVRDWITTQSVL